MWPIGKFKIRGAGDIKLDIQEVKEIYVMDWGGAGWGVVEGNFECSNELYLNKLGKISWLVEECLTSQGGPCKNGK